MHCTSLFILLTAHYCPTPRSIETSRSGSSLPPTGAAECGVASGARPSCSQAQPQGQQWVLAPLNTGFTLHGSYSLPWCMRREFGYGRVTVQDGFSLRFEFIATQGGRVVDAVELSNSRANARACDYGHPSAATAAL